MNSETWGVECTTSHQSIFDPGQKWTRIPKGDYLEIWRGSKEDAIDRAESWNNAASSIHVHYTPKRIS
tara:strand:+ start:205 stop:408 length:204 start_codon:yes stop_codon:yes gene_type:complete